MKYNLLLFALCFTALQSAVAQTIVPTQTDEIIIDNGTSGKADPNDRIRYRVTIQNTGAASGTNAQFNAVPDPKTTFIPGSFRSSPLAVPDAYTCTGNVGINVPAASGVKTNDFDDNLAGTTLSCGACTSANGGAVTLNNDGSFTYNPPAGFIGTDNFTYTITDGNPVGAPVPLTDNTTVTITVSNLIWFINNSAAAGDGRVNTPFNSLAAFNSGSAAAASVVYLEHTGTDYNGVLTLQAGERLFGEGHTGAANLSGVLPFALAPNSNPLPNINGSRPVIVNSGGNGIALATNNAVRGVNVGNTTGTDIVGSAFGTLTLSEVTLSGTGKALDLTNGTLSATFNSVTSTSSADDGMSLNSVAGTADLGSTTISGCTSAGIFVATSTANITFGNTSITPGTHGVVLTNNSAGTRTFGTYSVTNGSGMGFLYNAGGLTNITGQTTITNPGGRGVDIQNAVAANGVTFANVTITQTGNTGVYLNANAGNVTFADLDVTPDANIRAIQATENTGTITTTSGTISNSGNIGIEITKTNGTTPLAMVLTSVSASGSSSGIILSRTSGSFAVNGSGTTDGSGGTIQNMTARGVSCFTASGITLKNMTFTSASTSDGLGTCTASDNSGCNAAIYLNTVTNAVLDNVDIGATAQNGINITETSGFQLLNSTLTQNGNTGSIEEGGIFAINLFGTSSISNTTISFPAVRGVAIYNTNKNLNMTVTNSQFNDTQTSTLGADGFEIISFGNSITDMDVTGCTFLRDKTNGLQFLTENTANGTIDISGCTVDPGTGVGVAFDIASNGTSTLKYNVFNNNGAGLKGRATNIVNCFAQGSSTMDGQVSGNIVTSVGGSGSGIRTVVSGNANHRTRVINNTVSGIANDYGIVAQASAGTGRLDATITNNNVTVLSSAVYDIYTIAGASSSTFTNKVCANVANNTVAPSPISGSMIANYVARAATGTHELLLQGSVGPIATYWNNNGNLPASPTSTVLTSGLGTYTFGATCLLPSYP